MSKNIIQNAKTYSNFDKIGFIHLSLFFPAVISTGVALVVGFPRFVIERGVGYAIAFRIFI